MSRVQEAALSKILEALVLSVFPNSLAAKELIMN